MPDGDRPVESRLGGLEVRIAIVETKLDDLRHDLKNISQEQKSLTVQIQSMHDTLVAAKGARWIISAAAAVFSFALGVAASFNGLWARH